MAKPTNKADIMRWARGHELAQRKIAAEARRSQPSFQEALERVDDLRQFADELGATEVDDDENLAFHRAWAEVRKAFGYG